MTEQEQVFAEAGHWLYGPTERRDPKRARPVMERLNDEGFVPATFALGMMHYDGRGVRRDYAKAFAILERAAEAGYATAEVMVGTYHEMGFKSVVPSDPARARRLYRRAAEKGNSGAQYNLGRMLRGGLGGPADPAEAYLRQRLAVLCSPLRNRVAEVQASQLAQEFDAATCAELDAKAEAIAPGIRTERSEHLFYWRHLAGE